MESQFEPANGLEQLARQSFEFLCWIEDRVVWPLVISPSLLVGFLTVVIMRRGRSNGF
jgi:ABC-type molybdate transport system permease subunit